MDLFEIKDPIENANEVTFAEEMNSRQNNLHSTSIKNYYHCPHKFTLSRKHIVEKVSDAIINGKLFEGYLLGFKELPGYSEFEVRGLQYNKDGVTLNGRAGKQDKTVQPIKDKADYYRQFFEVKEGTPFIPIEYDGGFINGNLKGEIDYLGPHWINIEAIKQINLSGDEVIKHLGKFNKPHVLRKVMVDVKLTNDIYWRWYLKRQIQALQSILYPYIYHKMTGEIYDFVYFIVWDRFPTIFKQIYCRTTEKTFETAERLIDGLEGDLFKKPDCDIDNCLKGEFNTPCEYIEFCEEGRDLVSSPAVIESALLDSPRKFIPDSEIDDLFDKLNDGEFDND